IWEAVGRAARSCREQAQVPAADVRGISFDATCSTVFLTGDGRPVAISTSGDPQWDVIVWMDHRAVAEAEECNATKHRGLDYVGGGMSPEMATPKMMWVKRHLPESWARVGQLYDLADFLTWRASGN